MNRLAQWAIVMGLTAAALVPTAWAQCVDYALQPPLLGAYATLGEARDVVLDAHLAYVARGEQGLLVLDVTDPSLPILAGAAALTDDAYELAVAGQIVFVADYEGGLQVVDCHDPAAPEVIASWSREGLRAVALTVVGSRLYLCDLFGGLIILDVAEPRLPQLLGSVSLAEQSLDVAVVGDFAYVANLDGGLKAIYVGNPETALVAGEVQPGGGSPGWPRRAGCCMRPRRAWVWLSWYVLIFLLI